MRRRGPIVGLAGAAITAGSFLALLSITAGLDDILVNGEMLSMRGVFGDMFTDVTDEALVFPGDAAEFRRSAYAGDPDAPLLWAVEIVDYEEGDRYSVSISDGLGGGLFGPRPGADSVMVDTIHEPGADELVFSVRNDGDRPLRAAMMFVDDPGSVDIFADPESRLLAALVPLAVSGLAMLAGMVTMAAGAVLTLVDWRKTRGDRGRPAAAGEWRAGRWD